MLGAIAGDIIGSVFEWSPCKDKTFDLFSNNSRFTDDTVLTLAIAHSILDGIPYQESVLKYARQFPNAGYGASFKAWFESNVQQAYNSWGNGSAMRVSPIGFAFDNLEEVLLESEKTAAITHNHPEGIKGAQATASAVFLARSGLLKEEIKKYIEGRFSYNLSKTVDEIRQDYKFDVSCQGSVPESIIAFLESSSYEDTIRNAISLGGDADTQACIAGGIAQAFYRSIPKTIIDKIKEILPNDQWELMERFNEKFKIDY